MIDFCGPLGILLVLILVYTVSRHCDTCSSLSSCAQLDSGCACACSCVGCVLYVCESLKFEGGTMMVMVLRQYFQLSNYVGPAVQLKPGKHHLR